MYFTQFGTYSCRETTVFEIIRDLEANVFLVIAGTLSEKNFEFRVVTVLLHEVQIEGLDNLGPDY